MKKNITCCLVVLALAAGGLIGWTKYWSLRKELAARPPAVRTAEQPPAAPAVKAAEAEAFVPVPEPPEPPQREPQAAPKRAKPWLRFAKNGRYLPPGERPLVELESFDVTNVAVEVRRVEPCNIVQMLAREHRHYRKSWGGNADDGTTEELAGLPESSRHAVTSGPDGKGRVRIPAEMADGGSARGIFLLTCWRADAERNESYWTDSPNPGLYRVVCVTDIGLSVRRDPDGALLVWATSLTTGQPLPEACVGIYSTANILVGEGRTDEDGCCRFGTFEKGEAFVVAVATDNDLNFIPLESSETVDETLASGARDPYLASDGVEAYLWTERGIYRHGEKIFLQAHLRTGDGNAPTSSLWKVALYRPDGARFSSRNMKSDAFGVLSTDAFSVPDEAPSGIWRISLENPEKNNEEIGSCRFKIEEFVPPQIRVRVEADAAASPTGFAFTVSAEQLFGGPCNGFRCEGAVQFEDAPFAPSGWDGWRFGNADLKLTPAFRRLAASRLDASGRLRFAAPLLAESGRPAAAVRATAEGTVFENGGRPANARWSRTLHYYPFYLGVKMSDWMGKPASGRLELEVACVRPDGTRLAETRNLAARIERIDYSYRYDYNCLNSTRMRTTVAKDLPLATSPTENTRFEFPIDACGDYVLTIEDAESGVSFARTFYLSDSGDEAVRTSADTPTRVEVVPDRTLYRPGDTPHLVIKAPFAGHALVTLTREGVTWHEQLALTNATSELVLPTLTEADEPNLDVAISVVQGVAASARGQAVRAHGLATVRVRRADREIDVALATKAVDYRTKAGGKKIVAEVSAPGAAFVTVTAVDAGILLLTDEPVPDPLDWLTRARTADHPLYDLFPRILPVLEDDVRRTGVKTGGGGGLGLFRRMSPVPSRRFHPFARYQAAVPVVNGRATVEFPTGEFVGEVRVTAVAHSAAAIGVGSASVKVAPRLVMQPDAPRFVAPGDVFDLTLPVSNRGETDGRICCIVDWSTTNGVPARGERRRANSFYREIDLARGATTNLAIRVTASEAPGEMNIRYLVRGLDELHDVTLDVPVRPAVAWRTRAGVERLPAGSDTNALVRALRDRLGGASFDCALSASRDAELKAAFDWLAEYRYGCLEQTSSRVFPLIGDTNRLEAVENGVRRVESMVRANDFATWPDTKDAPWDPEVSLYAAHFLFEAERSGVELVPGCRAAVLRMLKRRVHSTNECHAAYASLSLALAGMPERDAMRRLYDRRARLSLLARARLALAFAQTNEKALANDLLASVGAPGSVREAAFGVLALLKLDADDARVLPLVEYLASRRDGARFCWGTTGENAHALLALGAYYRARPVEPGTWFASWRALDLPRPEEVKDEANGLAVTRRFLTPEGKPADPGNIARGDLLTVELTVSSVDARELSDLVIEDLFAGALEPVRQPTPLPDWVLRWEARDDRAVVFSKRFHLDAGGQAVFRYPVRAVTAGDFILPGPSVEAMYAPELRAVVAPARLRVK